MSKSKEKDVVAVESQDKRTAVITLVRPEGESAAAQRVSVNGRHYVIMYDQKTTVPIEVLAALQDARTTPTVTIPEGETIANPKYVEKPRFTVIVHE